MHIQNFVYLVNIYTLQSAAFITTTTDSTTLKSVLKSLDITKVFFDVCNDSNTLYYYFSVRLYSVKDVQLIENIVRLAGRHKFVNGLERYINNNILISLVEKRDWKDIKEKGLKLFYPNKGGSYNVFNTRPIDAAIKRYCINDI